MLLALLLSLSASASPSVPVNVASLGACNTHTLEIELNVDGKTPKRDLVEAIKILADYPSFTITPEHSEQSALRFLAKLNSNCVSDSCARADGWFDLQKRLERFQVLRFLVLNLHPLVKRARVYQHLDHLPARRAAELVGRPLLLVTAERPAATNGSESARHFEGGRCR